ncbi:hypothetical protein [Nonomuraea rubra]|uniref:Mycothiol-dependent maleylpyruvate isomerase metal-binding domain-containing protein n=1 Tax=Nonomuraea rubra TaxID=46180 RepID=A0A7X0P3M7_9ACTN|nr:hypothetical protein [Nonomuraea rubra]MBB6554587.1 hypothetical protein [Nonomuraea rubra]
MRSADDTVGGEDVRRVLALAIDTLRRGDPRLWDARAGTLEWTCWETYEHLADCLFTYAARFGLAQPPASSLLPWRAGSDREDGPVRVLAADRSAGPDGLLAIVEACGGLLASVERTADPNAVAHHVFGPAEPAGFAAMGLVETLVHTHDVAQGLRLEWSPPGDACARVLKRLFPHVTDDGDAWESLLWATGRIALPGRPRLTEWRWYNERSGAGGEGRMQGRGLG